MTGQWLTAVYAGSRDAGRGHRAAGRPGDRAVLTDVTGDASVAAAAKTIEADDRVDPVARLGASRTRLARCRGSACGWHLLGCSAGDWSVHHGY